MAQSDNASKGAFAAPGPKRGQRRNLGQAHLKPCGVAPPTGSDPLSSAQHDHPQGWLSLESQWPHEKGSAHSASSCGKREGHDGKTRMHSPPLPDSSCFLSGQRWDAGMWKTSTRGSLALPHAPSCHVTLRRMALANASRMQTSEVFQTSCNRCRHPPPRRKCNRTCSSSGCCHRSKHADPRSSKTWSPFLLIYPFVSVSLCAPSKNSPRPGRTPRSESQGSSADKRKIPPLSSSAPRPR